MSRLRVRALRPEEREPALAYLDRAARLNLYLADQVLRLGEKPRRSEPRNEVLAAWSGDRVAGLVSLQPTVVLDALIDRDALEAFFPYLSGVAAGLINRVGENNDVKVDAWVARIRS